MFFNIINIKSILNCRCYEHISFDWSLMEPLDYLTNNRYPIEAVVSFSIRHIYVPVFC